MDPFPLTTPLDPSEATLSVLGLWSLGSVAADPVDMRELVDLLLNESPWFTRPFDVSLNDLHEQNSWVKKGQV